MGHQLAVFERVSWGAMFLTRTLQSNPPGVKGQTSFFSSGNLKLASNYLVRGSPKDRFPATSSPQDQKPAPSVLWSVKTAHKNNVSDVQVKEIKVPVTWLDMITWLQAKKHDGTCKINIRCSGWPSQCLSKSGGTLPIDSHRTGTIPSIHRIQSCFYFTSGVRFFSQNQQ